MNHSFLMLLAGVLILCGCRKPISLTPQSPAPLPVAYSEELAPRTLSDWRDSKDGAVSFCLTVDKTTITKGLPIAVRGAVRNNTEKTITVLLPFGDPHYADSPGIAITGPDGVVPYRGPIYRYGLGTASFIGLEPHKVVEGVLLLSTNHHPDLNQKGLYRITYFFLSDGYPDRVPPENYWQGTIRSNSVDVLITDD